MQLDLLALQGRPVNVALSNRTCLDGAILQGVVEGDRLWLHSDGKDVIVDLDDVVDVWEPEAARRSAAAYTPLDDGLTPTPRTIKR